MLGIGNHNLEEAMQMRIHRAPIDPGTLHRYMGAAFLEQPVPKRDQIPTHGSKAPDFFACLSFFSNRETGNNEVLMIIDATTAWIHDIHLSDLLFHVPEKIRR